MRLTKLPLVRPNLNLAILSVIVVGCLSFCFAAPTYAQSKAATVPVAPTDAEISSALDAIKQIAKDGVGNEGAAAAMPTLNHARPGQLPMILEAFNGSSPLQRNWLMAAINQVVAKAKTDLPKRPTEEYFINYENDDYGRLVAFELMTRNNETLQKKMIRELWSDPSPPLRYMAIADLIQQAEQLEGDENQPAAIALLEKALDNALNVDQLQTIAKQLKAKGNPVNLREVMGFVSKWQIVAGFDNTDSKGFDVPYGPELKPSSVDLEAAYLDASKQSVQWQAFETDSDTGVFDLNKLIGNEKDRTAYAYTVFDSPVEGPVEVRLGTPNANKIWLNGKLVMTNEVYHNSNSIDKFVSAVNLVKGTQIRFWSNFVKTMKPNRGRKTGSFNFGFVMRIRSQLNHQHRKTDFVQSIV